MDEETQNVYKNSNLILKTITFKSACLRQKDAVSFRRRVGRL